MIGSGTSAYTPATWVSAAMGFSTYPAPDAGTRVPTYPLPTYAGALTASAAEVVASCHDEPPGFAGGAAAPAGWASPTSATAREATTPPVRLNGER